ncbi:MAG TPA: TIM-barrel domain-containing protein [Phycisphaerales bacterium]|nr:TIM-barrel domain-containing protein [Phycisphaerales bacterium]
MPRHVTARFDPAPILLADRTTRHRDPAHAALPLPPFPAYRFPPVELGPAPRSTRLRPRFLDKNALRHAYLSIEPGTSLYATGETAGPLRRNGRVTICWNTDSFDYTDKTRSLYQSHPFVLAVRRDGSAFGVICETTHWCRIDLRSGILFSSRGRSPAITIIERDSPEDVVAALSELTGTMPMPPRWALGYQQSRWSYEPDARVREIARGFRERGIPCDVLWFDIDYMDGFRCFTFDHDKFPDPAALNRDLHAQGFHCVYMIDPGIKVDPQYHVYAHGQCALPSSRSVFIQDHAGREHHGSVWPGPCAFPDFTNAHVRAWWAGLYHDFLARGVDGVWNDMNEPAIFDGPGKSMPSMCIHLADEDLGGHDTHARYHNIYGMQMVRASREGLAAATPDKRLFILTRASFLGGQRYAATWTGDNRSNWSHLRWAIPMALNLSLSGQPFVGPDIGGFVGDATPELFARFMGIGSLLPFARGHSIKDSRDHEPWAFGPDCETACRLALQRRYRLLPYLYTLFRDAATSGLPIIRPVFFARPADHTLRTIDHAFLLGPDLLISAAVTPEVIDPPDSPLAGWREFECVDAHTDHPGFSTTRAPPALPRLFIRPGAIIPFAPIAQHTAQSDVTRLSLLIAPADDGHARAQVYHDDGISHGHERGEYELIEFTADAKTSRLGRKVIHQGIAPTLHVHDLHAIEAGRLVAWRIETA